MKLRIFEFLSAIDSSDLSLPRIDLTSGSIGQVLRLVFGLAGAVSVLIITLAGLQYVLSRGEPQATAKAKETILYAVVGLIICITAFSIVTFMLGRI